MNAAKAVALGCVAVGLLGFVGMVVVFGFVYHISQEPEGLAVAVDAPLDVTAGETFPLVVTVTNERDGKSLTVTDIDIADEYLEGFVVVSVDPVEESSMDVPIDNSRSYTFNKEIPQGGSQVFTFNLRAQEPGVFRGDVDVVVGMRFTSVNAQTVVAEKEVESGSGE